MVIFNIVFRMLLKILNLQISVPVWAMLCIVVVWYSSICFTLHKVRKDELRREVEQNRLNEAIFIKDKYITNIMYKYVERVVEDIEDYEFTDKTKETLNVAISNIIK